MIKAIFFDMDGTLIDSDELVLKIYEELTNKYKPNMPLSTMPILDLMQKSYPEVISLLYGEHVPFYLNEITKIHQALVYKHLKLFPHVLDTLQELKQKGLLIFLVTSEVRSIALKELRILQIDKFFDEIIAFDDVKEGKPSPLGIHTLMNKWDLLNHEVIFVGDSPNDGKASMRAGVASIYLNYHQRDEISKHFNFVIDDIKYLNEFIDSFNPVYQFLIKNDKPFKIIQFADLHLMNNEKDEKSFALMRKMIIKHTPDLIILTGDQTMSKDALKLYKKLSIFLDSFEIKWSFVFGNHDTEHNISYEMIYDEIKSSKHLLFKKGIDQLGFGNYFIELNHQNEHKALIYLLDSHIDDTYLIDDHQTWGYGEINPKQMQWFNQVSKQYQDVDGYMFFHIPPYEFRSVDKSSDSYDGLFLEQTSTPPKKSDLMTYLIDSNIKSLYVGHDHYNDFSFKISDILFAYGRISGYYDYSDIKISRGARLIEIDLDLALRTYIDIL